MTFHRKIIVFLKDLLKLSQRFREFLRVLIPKKQSCKNKKARNDLSKNGRNLVDGKGASRIAEAMLKII